MKTLRSLVLSGMWLGVSAQGSIFSNGSFEFPVVPPGAWALPDGSTLGPWTLSLPSTEVAELINTSHVGLAPYVGDQYLSFNGFNRPSGGQVYQDFDTVASVTYIVGFAIGRLGATGGVLELEASALAGTSTLSTMSAIAPTASGTWMTHTFSFIATTPTTRILFTDISGTTDSMDVALDGVTIVPAPGALALVGLGGLFAVRRRR